MSALVSTSICKMIFIYFSESLSFTKPPSFWERRQRWWKEGKSNSPTKFFTMPSIGSLELRMRAFRHFPLLFVLDPAAGEKVFGTENCWIWYPPLLLWLGFTGGRNPTRPNTNPTWTWPSKETQSSVLLESIPASGSIYMGKVLSPAESHLLRCLISLHDRRTLSSFPVPLPEDWFWIQLFRQNGMTKHATEKYFYLVLGWVTAAQHWIWVWCDGD